jgi:hypothetical protein
MAVERRGQVTYGETGSTGNRRNSHLVGERQLSAGGTSRMNREVHVRIREGLGVQFPGPTRRDQRWSSLPRPSEMDAFVNTGRLPRNIRRSVKGRPETQVAPLVCGVGIQHASGPPRRSA